MQHPAFLALTAADRHCYLCMILEAKGQLCFQFSRCTAAIYGISNSTLRENIKHLINAGFSDKVKYYTGFENNRKQRKEGTRIEELTVLAATATDFTESDIVERNAKIIFNFVEFMHSNDLLCED